MAVLPPLPGSREACLGRKGWAEGVHLSASQGKGEEEPSSPSRVSKTPAPVGEPRTPVRFPHSDPPPHFITTSLPALDFHQERSLWAGGRGLPALWVSMDRSPLWASVSLFVKKKKKWEELNQNSSSLGQSPIEELVKETITQVALLRPEQNFWGGAQRFSGFHRCLG